MTHPDKDNQAERAAFEAWATGQGHMIDSALETGGRMYVSSFTRRAWDVWQAARAAPPALGAEGMPALPRHKGPIDTYHDDGTVTSEEGWSADQVRQAQHEAVAAYARRLDPAIDKLRQQVLETHAAASQLARQDQQPARASVDGPKFKWLLGQWLEAREYWQDENSPHVKAAWIALIAHINAWGGVEQPKGEGDA